MRTLLTSVALTMLFAVGANADVIHTTDYEADGAAAGTGTTLGVQPASMQFTDGGGDFIGQPGLGLSDVNARSGSYSYVVDSSMTVDNGNGWGGNWSGMNSNSGTGSGGFFADEAAAVAAGPGSQYVVAEEGCTFTVSGWAATDADGVTSGATLAPRLEFQGAGGELFRNDAGATAASTLTETFQLFTHSYTITAADAALGISHVTGVIGTDALGFDDTVGGNIYFDDFTFEVDSGSVRTVPAVPEPTTATLLLGGLLGLCGIRRRKS